MDAITFAVSGVAMASIQGSELWSDPAKYEAGSDDAREAHRALHAASARKVGKGLSFPVTTTLVGARVIEDFCLTVGQSLVLYSGVEYRPEGRALLLLARRIAEAAGGRA